MKSRILIIAGILTFQLTPFAQSGEPDALVDLAPGPVHKSWHFEIGSYTFLSGIDGTVESGGHSVDFDFEFADIFEQLDFAFMLAATATYENKFTLLTDIQYIGISASGSPRGPRYDRAEVELDEVIFTLIGGWRVWDGPEGFVEVGAGFRYLWADTNVEVRDSTGRNPTLKSGSESNILDGLVAIRGSYQMGPKWGLRFYGDVGAGDSDLTWQVWCGLGYTINDRTAALLGYRHLAYELSDGSTNLDISFSGPQVGFVHRF